MSNFKVQTHQPPFDDLELIESHIRFLYNNVDWDQLGVLTDQDNKNTVVVLIDAGRVVAIFRINVSPEASSGVLQSLRKKGNRTLLGHYQGFELSQKQITSLTDLTEIWSKIRDQVVELTDLETSEFFTALEESSKKKGRGDAIGVETKRTVIRESHGRCMFRGCGEDLFLEAITGNEGNYSYLAHNVASSEQGERGGAMTSRKLSNTASNVLLLCDKHHRLIDKVAGADYPASKLSEMRRDFIETADRLLDGLAFEPISTFAVLWPVGGHVIAPPTHFQISQALQVIRKRPDGSLSVVADNDELLLSADPSIWSVIPGMINRVAQKIQMQTQFSQNGSAIFAFGLMPQLIGLGAKLGNKGHYVPMLRSRDTGSWAWPSDEARYPNITVNRSPDPIRTDVIVTLSFTAKPPLFEETASQMGFPTIEITVEDEFIGNGAISHPEEGQKLLQTLHQLLHELGESGVTTVHLFPCISNCGSVFAGMAIDRNHPSVLVYDFSDRKLLPRLMINTREQGIEVSPPLER
jgi:hypothetical protein